MPNTQDTQTKPQSAFQRFKAPIRKSLIYKVIFHPIRSIKNRETLFMTDDERFLYLRHKDIFGYKADFKNPKTFNEKIIHRILYDRNPIYTYLADKLKARIYIANKLQGFTQDNIGIREREREQRNLNLAESKDNLRDSKQNNNSNISDDSNSSNSIDSNTLQTLQQPIDSLSSKLFDTNACEFLPKLYGIWKSVDDIDFDKLPNSFVLKTNHDCGGVVLVPNKQDFLANKDNFNKEMQKLRKHLARNYYEFVKEYHYKDIEPRVFAEELLLQDNADPTTYKFHIFKGNEAHNFIQVTTERFSDNYQRAIMDYEWNLTPFGLAYDNSKVKKIPSIPTTLQSMINIAHILANPFNYVRVDLYNIDCGNGAFAPFVGELTWTPMGGVDKFVPIEYDKIIGNLWHIKDS
ncbi:ATP-grasp fold amidoligase family protein [Helicobacter macacae]|uniref:Uncharacterized protein n=1 Tax=Helicobacter macacae MIT 99-5501 TaxID=1357400 RepID=V8CD75_9HELI|nr:ATP-grasp fold amidoligase family protein [Helicobacter macacae]ETD24945.1 hypothetical protein HMPREF2086_00279 [Helicobacter macacae MIT 99-5501]